MWESAISTRWETRLKFLQHQSKHGRTYKSDLQFCLLASKKILQEVLSAKILPVSRIDRSTDTVQTHSVSLAHFQRTLALNSTLVAKMRSLKQNRQTSMGQSLIVKQLAQESYRVEMQKFGQQQELLSEHKYSLNRKNASLQQVQQTIFDFKAALGALKGSKPTVLTSENLAIHSRLEGLKLKLTVWSRRLINTEKTTEKLQEYAEQLRAQCEKYRILAKKPSIRSRREVDTSWVVDSSEDQEELFPRNVKQPDRLPNARLFQPRDEMDDRLKTLVQIKGKAVDVYDANRALAEQLRGGIVAGTERPARKSKKATRATSNVGDYIYKHIIQDDTLNMNVSSVSSGILTEEEADSVLMYCMNELD